MSYLTNAQAKELAEELALSEYIVSRTNSAIDILTYSRINAIGFENLTEFQQRIINECAFEIAQFFLDNKDVLDMPLSAYSINGVSMQFNFNKTVHCSNGVIVPETAYRKLMSTNLCYGGI